LTEIQIFPNPSINRIEINWAKPTITSIDIFDIQGKHFGNIPVNQGETSKDLNISHLQPGSYLLRLHSKSGKYFSQAFIKH
jgi:hypothetical protein